MDTKQKKGQDPNLLVFNGIRTLMIFWVIYGHVALLVITFGFTNLIESEFIMGQKEIVVIIAGFYTVDVFFFLGGFFAAFGLIGRFKKKSLTVVSYFQFIALRALRILPCYAVCLLVYWKLETWVGKGPVFADYS